MPEDSISKENAQRLMQFLASNISLRLKPDIKLDDVLEIGKRDEFDFQDNYEEVIFTKIKDLIAKYIKPEFKWQLPKEDIPEDISKFIQVAIANKDGIIGYEPRALATAINYMVTNAPDCFGMRFDSSGFYKDPNIDGIVELMKVTPRMKHLESLIRDGIKLKDEVKGNMERYFDIEIPDTMDYDFQNKLCGILKEEGYQKTNTWGYRAKAVGMAASALILGLLLGKSCDSCNGYKDKAACPPQGPGVVFTQPPPKEPVLLDIKPKDCKSPITDDDISKLMYNECKDRCKSLTPDLREENGSWECVCTGCEEVAPAYGQTPAPAPVPASTVEPQKPAPPVPVKPTIEPKEIKIHVPETFAPKIDNYTQ